MCVEEDGGGLALRSWSNTCGRRLCWPELAEIFGGALECGRAGDPYKDGAQ